MKLGTNTNTVKHFRQAVFIVLGALGLLFLSLLIAATETRAYTASSEITVANKAGSAILDDSFEVRLMTSAANTVQPGGTLRVYGTVMCTGDDSSGQRTVSGRSVSPWLDFGQATVNCPPAQSASVGYIDVPISSSTAPGTYYLDTVVRYVGPVIDSNELVMFPATHGYLRYDVVASPPPTQPPTANLTVNGVDSVTVTPGSALNYAWSSTDGNMYSSTYLVTQGSSGCPGYPSGPWTANTAAGTSNETAASSQVGCTYSITYNVNGDGGSQSDSITVAIQSGPVGGSCTGTIPNGAGAWDSEESTGLSSNVSWTHSSADTATKCQFRCVTGTWNSSTGQCEGAPPPPPPPPGGANLEVTVAGNGQGAVTSNPAGFNCSPGCTETRGYESGTTVTLFKTAQPGSTAGAWQWDCAGQSGSCTLTIYSSDKRAYTSFNLVTHRLEVFKAGSGSGRVTSTPSGIDCGANCAAYATPGTTITLGANPDSGSSFASWSGCDSVNGSGQCVVTMNSDRNVTATFDGEGSFPDLRPLSITAVQFGSQGGTASFQSYPRNYGTVSTGAGFTTRFEYKWGSYSSPWEPYSGGGTALGNKSYSALAAGATGPQSHQSSALTLDNNGPLTIMYCVDTGNGGAGTVYEGLTGETNNCGVKTYTVNPGSGAPAVTLTANPGSILEGNSSTLTWTPSNATACTATNQDNDADWSGSVAFTGTNDTDVTPDDTTWYRITCSNSTQYQTRREVTVYVTPTQPDLVTQNFSATPSEVAVGEPIFITGNTYNQGNGGTGTGFGAGFTDRLQVRTGFNPWSNWLSANRAALAAGASTAALQGNYTPSSAGTYYFRHCADADGSVTESDENNNCTESGAVTVNSPGVSGEIYPSGCFIAENESTCSGMVWWESTNANNPSILQNGVQFSTSANQSSPGVSRTLNYSGTGGSPNVFEIDDGTTQLDIETASALCAAGLIWDSVSSTCVSGAPTIDADPRVIEEGSQTTVSWTVPDPEACTLSGGGYNNEPISSLGSGITPTLEATTTFIIDCGAYGSDSVTVEVVPKNFET